MRRRKRSSCIRKKRSVVKVVVECSCCCGTSPRKSVHGNCSRISSKGKIGVILVKAAVRIATIITSTNTFSRDSG